MKSSEMYRVDVENKEIVVRLKAGLIEREAVTRFLDYLELESIRKRSRLTEEQAVALAEEVDRGLWESTKHKVDG
jgi:hypothetical protein